MLLKQNKDQQHQLQMVTIDDLVLADQMVRKIEASINFDFIYDLVETYYSKDQGRPSIDPVALIKIVLIQYIFVNIYLEFVP